MLSELADNKKIFYIDINELFGDGKGNLRNELTGDGTHVYAKYYRDWCDWLYIQRRYSRSPFLTVF